MITVVYVGTRNIELNSLTLAALEIPRETAAYSCFEKPATLAIMGRFGSHFLAKVTFQPKQLPNQDFANRLH